MKMTTAYAMTWLSTAIAVSVGIIVSGNLTALWAFAFPGLISWSSSGEKDK